jgi:hypothetical protein
MKVLVVDQRNGDVVTDDIKLGVQNADCVLYIQADGHVKVEMREDIKTVRIEGAFIRSPGRDEISAAHSRVANSLREQKRDEEAKAQDPEMTAQKQFARVWEDSPDHEHFPGNHGTARISGKL